MASAPGPKTASSSNTDTYKGGENNRALTQDTRNFSAKESVGSSAVLQPFSQAAVNTFKKIKSSIASPSKSTHAAGPSLATSPQNRLVLRLRGGSSLPGVSLTPKNKSSTIDKSRTVPPIASGTRQVGFVQGWLDANKEQEHFDKHVIGQKEFQHATKREYSIEAFSFWEKPIVIGPNGANIFEKTGSNGKLYRFEPSTGILGVARIKAKTNKVIQSTYFKPAFLDENMRPNPNFLKDALAYYHDQ